MPVAADKTAPKFRAMAEKLAAEIEGKRRDRRENTPKQAKEALSQRIDADHLERVRVALVNLADAREAGTLPASLGKIASKADLLTMLRTRIDCSGGYYSIRDTGEFCDQSYVAIELRAFLDAAAGPVDEAEVRRRKAAEMERDVKFRPIPGFFPTPPAVIDLMLDHADVWPDMTVLEPSAGKGDIVEALQPKTRAVTCFEINPILRDILKAKGFNVEAVADFLVEVPPTVNYLFDRVVMNPPFERGQDIDHVRHAYQFLKPGGRLVAIMSAGPFFRSDKKSFDFRAWLDSVGGERHNLPEDAFKGAFRSTGTKTNLVAIDRAN